MFYLYIFETEGSNLVKGITKNMQLTIIEHALVFKSKLRLLDVKEFKRKKDALSVLETYATEPTVVIEKQEKFRS